MLRNYFLINILLVLVIGILGYKLYGILSEPEEIPSEATVRELPKGEGAVKVQEPPLGDSAFENIAKLDLFRPSRSSSGREGKKTEPAVLKEPPKLFGTVILNDLRTAIIEDPDSGKTKVYRLDDSISGYKISEIHENRVVLLRDGDKVEVKLREDKGIQPVRRQPAISPAQRQAGVERPVPQRRKRPATPRRRPSRVRPPAESPEEQDEELPETPPEPDLPPND
ncbi:MAG: hypothetical protein JSU90_03360 [Nitrospiraceae bacterium]|nr:MAG: hypothetical protein JSU90_03360 [Nitrospiraceae bacterium]